MTPERFQKIRTRLARRQPDLTVLAENVHKSHNIAAILRTADAVGVYRVHAVSESGEIRDHHMVSGGTRKWVPVILHESTAAAFTALHEQGFQVIAAHPDPQAKDYRQLDYTLPTAILLGAELDGLSEEARCLADVFVSVPMEGMVASLNVSVAAALILYEARRQRESAGLYDICRIPEEEFRQTLFEWAHPELARRCRDRGLPYPAMSADGDLQENPFAAASD
ncbi:MAG: tRNA (guanosine(18)-2'-O)-methyltransferase TrmH [Woeseiaceae bacterium]|nr:tRNA (guanosine(18)-2'-O)-methyltransferase TrmH [Woeseiaceae bacterium]